MAPEAFSCSSDTRAGAGNAPLGDPVRRMSPHWPRLRPCGKGRTERKAVFAIPILCLAGLKGLLRMTDAGVLPPPLLRIRLPRAVCARARLQASWAQASWAACFMHSASSVDCHERIPPC
jgi:hypothetical protein